MFERFTDEALKVVVRSQEHARERGHNWIGTEHIWLGLFDVLELDNTALAQELTKILPAGFLSPAGHIPFTPRSKKGLENALRTALNFGHNYIGPNHLVLGMLDLHDGIGYEVLNRLGKVDELHDMAIEYLSKLPTEPIKTRQRNRSDSAADALERIADTLDQILEILKSE